MVEIKIRMRIHTVRKKFGNLKLFFKVDTYAELNILQNSLVFFWMHRNYKINLFHVSSYNYLASGKQGINSLKIVSITFILILPEEWSPHQKGLLNHDWRILRSEMLN